MANGTNLPQLPPPSGESPTLPPVPEVEAFDLNLVIDPADKIAASGTSSGAIGQTKVPVEAQIPETPPESKPLVEVKPTDQGPSRAFVFAGLALLLWWASKGGRR